MGFGDLNSLIKFRDANPSNPIKPVFMVYNKPAFSIVGRKSRGVTKPKDLEGKVLGAPPPDGAFAQWKIFVQANGIDASTVKLERLRMALRDNILTDEVKAEGFGGVNADRLAKSIDQIALTYEFKNGKPKAADAFDASFLPPAAERKAN